MTVSFYVVEPAAGESQTFEGVFPADEVLDQVRILDLSTGQYHVKDGLFANEVFCTVHEGPQPILGAYNKDMYASVMTERKGEIREVEMSDGEGVVDASYVAFFPNSVAAVVRTSIRSPGSARIGNWLTLFGGHPCYFSALPTADTMARLNQLPTEIRRVVFRARRGRFPAIREANRQVAEALEAASKVSTSSKVGLTLGVERRAEKPGWWTGMRSVISDIAEVLPEFDTARVEVTKGKDVNLLDAYVSTRVEVELDGVKRIRPHNAAQALVEAYDSEKDSIDAALASWRS